MKKFITVLGVIFLMGILLIINALLGGSVLMFLHWVILKFVPTFVSLYNFWLYVLLAFVLNLVRLTFTSSNKDQLNRQFLLCFQVSLLFNYFYTLNVLFNSNHTHQPLSRLFYLSFYRNLSIKLGLTNELSCDLHTKIDKIGICVSFSNVKLKFSNQTVINNTVLRVDKIK